MRKRSCSAIATKKAIGLAPAGVVTFTPLPKFLRRSNGRRGAPAQ
jgi:hypothetical protein